MQNMFNNPMRVSDCASLMRVTIANNERPYTKTVLKYNNKLVDEWEEQVLKKVCNNKGCVRAGEVWQLWQVYHDGKTIPQLIKLLESGNVSKPAPEVVKYWISVFETYTLEQLIELGPMAVGFGFKLLIDETFISSCLEKWNLVYKDNTDPLKWRELANDNPKLWAEGKLSFWSEDQNKEILQKIETILGHPIKPAQ
jgi:hypothetical protein